MAAANDLFCGDSFGVVFFPYGVMGGIFYSLVLVPNDVYVYMFSKLSACLKIVTGQGTQGAKQLGFCSQKIICKHKEKVIYTALLL